MRILLVSDTHRHNDNYLRVLKRVGKIDMVIHCGDSEGSEYILSEAAPCPFYIVTGNNDFFSNLPREEEISVAGHKILVTHGHTYGVHRGYDMLVEAAKAGGYDVVMFGHIHMPVFERHGDVTVINPGSISFPRQRSRVKTYGILTVDDVGDFRFDFQSVSMKDF